MSEIRIINQVIHQSLDHKIKSAMTDDFVRNLRIGEVVNAKLIISENKHWLVLESIKIFIPEETVEQWKFEESQSIKLKVTSLKEPIELQIIDNKVIPKDSEKEIDKAQTSVVSNDAEKLILEVRKYINKPEASKTPIASDSPLIQTKKIVNEQPTTEQTEKPTHPSITTAKITDDLSQQIQSLISNSKSYVKDGYNNGSVSGSDTSAVRIDAPIKQSPTILNA